MVDLGHRDDLESWIVVDPDKFTISYVVFKNLMFIINLSNMLQGIDTKTPNS